jgi:hypothetical protein
VNSKRKQTAIAALALTCLAAAGMIRGMVAPVRNETCAQYELLTDVTRLGLPTSQVSISGFPRQKNLDGALLSPPPLSNLWFTIRRTYGLPAWLFRPTHAIPGPKEPDDSQIRTLLIDGQEVPVKFSYAKHRIRQRFAAYTFGYDGEPVLSPFWARLLGSPLAAFVGPRPITYIGIAGDEDPIDMPALEAEATRFIEAAWRLYREACRP